VNKNLMVCVIILFLSTSAVQASAQTLNALTGKINEVQARFLKGLEFQQANEYDKAITEFTAALIGQKELLDAVAMMPAFQKTILDQMLTTSSSIAYCHECKGDAATAMKWYREILAIAKTCSFKFKESLTESSIANLHVKMYDYRSANEHLERLAKNITDSEAAAKEGSAEDHYRILQATIECRNTALNIFQLGLTLGKYDNVLRQLKSPDFLELEQVCEEINPSWMEKQYMALKESKPDAIFNMLGVFNSAWISNINARFMIPTYRGICLRMKGDYEDALKSFAEAARSLDSIDETSLAKAIELMKEAGKASESIVTGETGELFRNLIDSFARKGTKDLVQLYRINNKCHRARTYDKMGQHDRAMSLYREALSDSERVDAYTKKFLLPRIYTMMGLCLFNLGRYDQALEAAKKTRENLPPHMQMNDILDINAILLGRIYELKGDRSKAEKYYREAVDASETIRLLSRNSGHLEEFFDQRLGSYEGLTRLLADEGDTVNSLTFAERSKAATLAEHFAMNVKPALPNEQHRKKYDEILLHLQKEQARQEEKIKAGLEVSEAEKKQLEVIKDGIRDFFKTTLDTIDKQNLFAGRVLDVPESMKLLDPDTIVIDYFYDTQSVEKLRKTRAWLVSSKTIEAVTLSASPGELENLIMEMRRQIGERDEDWKVTARALYKALIAPFEEKIRGKKRLVISPFRWLYYLPFSALLDGNDRPLVSTYSIAMIPSLTALKICREKKTSRGNRTIAYALGDIPVRGFSPLPGTELEVAEIRKILPDTTVVSRTGFVKDSMVDQVRGKDYIHIATHGILNSDDPEQSGFVTADSIATLPEIMAVKLEARMVVLSACETGLGKLYPGDDQVGLTRAFMFAGSSTIVSSLWSVSDESTAKLMSHFYRNIVQNNMDRAEALRQAELTLMKEYPDPFHWAPFILTGNWE